MRTVGIEAFEGSLGEYVRAAEFGEIVAVKDRGRVVATIGPPHPTYVSSEEAILERGVREGWLSRAEVDWRQPFHDSGPAPLDDPDVAFEALMADIARDRDDR